MPIGTGSAWGQGTSAGGLPLGGSPPGSYGGFAGGSFSGGGAFMGSPGAMMFPGPFGVPYGSGAMGGSGFTGALGINGGNGFSGGSLGTMLPGGVPRGLGGFGPNLYGSAGLLYPNIAANYLYGTNYTNPALLGLANQAGLSSPYYAVPGQGADVIGTFSTSPVGLAGGTYGATTTFTPPPASPVPFTFGALSPRPTMRSPEVARQDLQDVLAHSSSLPSKDRIQVAMQGEVIVLRGAVADDHERQLAELLIRLSPGVHDVRNDLQVRPVSNAVPGP
jgi:hypothetical protein